MEQSEPSLNTLSEAELERISIGLNKHRIERAIAIIATRPKRYWQDSGLCSALDPDLFDADKLDERGKRRAKEVCNECSVVAECTEYALGGKGEAFDSMILAAMTPDEVKEKRSQATRAKRRQRGVRDSQ